MIMYYRSRHTCSTRRRMSRDSDLTRALINSRTKISTSSVHLPPTSIAKTTRRTRTTGPTNSGYVISLSRFSAANATPSWSATPLLDLSSSLIAETNVVSTVSCPPSKRRKPVTSNLQESTVTCPPHSHIHVTRDQIGDVRPSASLQLLAAVLSKGNPLLPTSLSSSMLREDDQRDRLSGHTRTCVWTEKKEVGDDVEGAFPEQRWLNPEERENGIIQNINPAGIHSVIWRVLVHWVPCEGKMSGRREVLVHSAGRFVRPVSSGWQCLMILQIPVLWTSSTCQIWPLDTAKPSIVSNWVSLIDWRLGYLTTVMSLPNDASWESLLWHVCPRSWTEYPSSCPNRLSSWFGSRSWNQILWMTRIMWQGLLSSCRACSQESPEWSRVPSGVPEGEILQTNWSTRAWRRNEGARDTQSGHRTQWGWTQQKLLLVLTLLQKQTTYSSWL